MDLVAFVGHGRTGPWEHPETLFHHDALLGVIWVVVAWSVWATPGADRAPGVGGLRVPAQPEGGATEEPRCSHGR
jgi:hypothetical protein